MLHRTVAYEGHADRAACGLLQEGLKARHMALMAALEDMDRWLLMGEGLFSTLLVMVSH
jgi:hypothetical protein